MAGPSPPSRSGYSGKALHAKLGLKPGDRLLLLKAPPGYFDWLELPQSEMVVAAKAGKAEPFIHLFLHAAADLDADLKKAAACLAKNGVLWASWRKGKRDGIGDIEIRDWALLGELVDVKVCSVSEEWSGLKLVYRKNRRGDGG